MKKQLLITILFILSIVPSLLAQSIKVDSLELIKPKIVVNHIDSEFKVKAYSNGEIFTNDEPVSVSINGQSKKIDFTSGVATFKSEVAHKQDVQVEVFQQKKSVLVNPIPLWFGIIPPLIAILFALIFKEVFSALMLGLLSGTFIISLYQGEGVLMSILNSFLRVIDTYILQAVIDKGHISIIIFSMLIGGMVGIITKNGGMHGLVKVLSKRAQSSRSGQLVTWFLGIAIFFDDYANTLVVGNTMQKITDKLRISREKLAYIVDSTAAPIAAIAFITTWIGAELSYIQDGINNIGIDSNPYNVFFSSLKYSFYPILTLIFVFLLIFMRRDYGNMYKHEKLARQGKYTYGKSDDSEEEVKASNALNALVPVFVIIFGTVAGLLATGWDSAVWHSDVGFGNKLSHIIGQGDSFKALLWSSLAGVIVALLLSTGQRLLKLSDAIEAMIKGFKSMLTAIIILSLAWALALLTEHLHTAEFISYSMQQLSVSPHWVPAISFVFSAFIAFSTGSSWGTMAIMYPLILPATWMICQEHGFDPSQSMMIFNNVVSTVIAGSVLGDHCSPISDTTILSSLASGCSHIKHVNTQMPYALTVGGVALFLGVIPSAFGVPSYILIPVDIIIMILIIRFFGKKLPTTKLSVVESV